MMTEAILARLHPSLRIVLQTELESGNTIVLAEESLWSCGPVWMLSLSKPFTRRHDELPNIQFLRLNDPHYWGEEWSAEVEGEKQTITSPFVYETRP